MKMMNREEKKERQDMNEGFEIEVWAQEIEGSLSLKRDLPLMMEMMMKEFRRD